MIVDVLMEDETICIACIIDEDRENNTFHVKFLDSDKSNNVYNFNEVTDVIPCESVIGFYDTDYLEDTGLYKKIQNGYEMIEDSDYEPETETDDESESSISLDEEDDF